MNRAKRKTELFDDIGRGFEDQHNRASSHDDLDFLSIGFQSANGMEEPIAATGQQLDMTASFHSPPPQSDFFSGTNDWNPLANSITTDLAFNIGLGTMDQVQKETASRYWAFFEKLKVYFNVSNSYVLYKLLYILLPFRRRKQATTTDEFTRDLNAPDLYIPSMFFITYVLLVSALRGTKDDFTPEVLTSIASTGLILLSIEAAIIKLGFYLLSTPNTFSILDIAAFSGYKYVGIVLSLLISALIGFKVYLPVCILLSLMMCLFMIKTLRRASVNQYDGGGMRLQIDSSNSKRNSFIILISLFQIPMFFLLTYRYAKDEYSLLSWLAKMNGVQN